MTQFAQDVGDLVSELEEEGKLSKTGPGRFDPLRELFASELGTDLDDVYIIACARPNNLNIRLSQGVAQHRHHRFGLGVITAKVAPEKEEKQQERWLEGGLKAGSHFIAEGNAKYDAVGVMTKKDGAWQIVGVVEGNSSDVAARLSPHYPSLVVEKVKPGLPESTSPPAGQPASAVEAEQLVPALHESLTSANLLFPPDLVHRFVAALLSKPFLILTGLPGSGKTKLAQAFATWLTPVPPDGESPYFRVVPVGADWTSSEQVLGYPDALNPRRYETQPSLELVLAASQPGRVASPHLLILDEMNMSHVERYFSEFLSALESGARIDLYAGNERDAVPRTIHLPPNLYVIGTVNVDETTYLFSPKVLDRANVIEFRADEDQVLALLEALAPVDIQSIRAGGASFAESFCQLSTEQPVLSTQDKEELAEVFRRIFQIMKVFGREFGFRTMIEASRYLFHSKRLTAPDEWNIDEAIDALIYQRVLPKLNGSRAQLQLVLWALGTLCLGEFTPATFETQLLRPLQKRELPSPFNLESPSPNDGFSTAKYPLSASKIHRMCERLQDGFASFMEG